MSKIKICGLRRLTDIEAANRFCPDYVGFVFAKSRRQVSDEEAAVLRKALDPSIPAVGVFINDSVEHMAALVRDGIIQIIQLHGDEDETTIERLRSLCDATIIRAVKVSSESDIQKAQNSSADYLLLDNTVAGSGQAFSWDQLRACQRPYFLAGGVNLDNIDAALRWQPFAIDVSSGVETDGWKDAAKMEEMIRRVRRCTSVE